MPIKRLKLSDLTHDEELTSIRKITLFDVSTYVQNMKQGNQFPLMIVDKAVNEDGKHRICSGNHRWLAYKNVFGEDHELDVDMRSFNDEREFYELAISENITHGIALTHIARRLFADKLCGFGATDKEIASVFNISEAIVDGWKLNHRIVVKGKARKTIVLPLKSGANASVSNIVQTGANTGLPSVDQDKYKEHMDKDIGIPMKRLAEQITRHLANGWIDPKDTETIDALKDLKQYLDVFLGTVSAPLTNTAQSK